MVFVHHCQNTFVKVEHDGAVRPPFVKYSTPKSVPGWNFCPTNGEWYSDDEFEERCPEDYQEFRI